MLIKVDFQKNLSEVLIIAVKIIISPSKLSIKKARNTIPKLYLFYFFKALKAVKLKLPQY